MKLCKIKYESRECSRDYHPDNKTNFIEKRLSLDGINKKNLSKQFVKSENIFA